MNILSQLSIGWHLLRREGYILAQSWRGKATNALIIVWMFYLSFGCFLPAMGMPREMVLPAFIGGVISFCLMIAESLGLELSFDLDRENMIGYHCALPLPVSLVMMVYTLGSVMRTTIIMVPIFAVGLFFLSAGHTLIISPLFVVAVMFLTFVFFAQLFLCMALLLSTESLMGNVWPRFLVPLFIFGCNFYPWQSVATYAPRLARVMSFNPFTMATEGMRGALLGAHDYLNTWWCIGGLLTYCVIAFAVCLYGLRKRVVPVGLVRRA